MSRLSCSQAGKLAAACHGDVLDLLHGAWMSIIEPAFSRTEQPRMWEKLGGEPVTEIDLQAEEFLRTKLRRLIPEAGFLGEETEPANPQEGELCWVVDPLDGTANFAQRNKNFGLIIALLANGLPIGGWIYAPARCTMCWAFLGKGAFINDRRVALGKGEVSPPYRVAVAKGLGNTIHQTRESKQSCKVDAPSSAAVQYIQIIEARLDASIFDRARPWDHMAGALLINEAGGRCARPSGSAFQLGDGGHGLIAAGHPRVWETVTQGLYCTRDHAQIAAS